MRCSDRAVQEACKVVGPGSRGRAKFDSSSKIKPAFPMTHARATGHPYSRNQPHAALHGLCKS